MEGTLLRMVAVGRDFIGGTRELGDTLTEITRLGCTALAADMGGLTLIDAHRGPETAVSTDTIVLEIDRAQYDADRGPCLDAARDGLVHRARGSDLDRKRWPDYIEAAELHGIHSTLSIPVSVGDRSVGSLNFYGRAADRFDDDSAVTRGEAFAAQAAIVAAYCDKAELADHLQRAMESRATIEQAKGVIMATVGCSPEVAFDVLRQQSQNENRKLRDVAAEIVARQQRR